MFIDVCPSNLTSCFTCHKKISRRSIRVSNAGHQYYHLSCYQHTDNSPILFSSLKLKKFIYKSDIEEVKRWVEKWNEQFVVTPEKVPAQFLTKSVATGSTSFRRLFLEVFKFLTLSTVETGVALVCKEWFHVSRDEELWKTRIVLEFSTAETKENASNRTQYITLRLSVCWHCKKIPSLENIWMVCPYYKRPICKQCKGAPTCQIVPLDSYLKSHYIKKTTAELLKVPNFMYKGKCSTYLHLVAKVICSYAKHRRDLLLEKLQTKHVAEVSSLRIESMRQYDLDFFYEQRWAFRDYTLIQLIAFCGKNEKKVKLERNIETFLENSVATDRYF